MTTDKQKNIPTNKKTRWRPPKNQDSDGFKKTTKMATDKKVTLSLQPEVHKPMGRHGDRI